MAKGTSNNHQEERVLVEHKIWSIITSECIIVYLVLKALATLAYGLTQLRDAGRDTLMEL